MMNSSSNNRNSKPSTSRPLDEGLTTHYKGVGSLDNNNYRTRCDYCNRQVAGFHRVDDKWRCFDCELSGGQTPNVVALSRIGVCGDEYVRRAVVALHRNRLEFPMYKHETSSRVETIRNEIKLIQFQTSGIGKRKSHTLEQTTARAS